MKRLKTFLFALLLLLFCGSAMAQTTTSNIKGLVVDENSVPFSGANVIATHTPSGTKKGVITNDDGRFNLLNLRVGGPYKVVVSYLGYKTQTFDNVYLTLGKTESIAISMVEDAEQLEAVIVTGTTGTNVFWR